MVVGSRYGKATGGVGKPRGKPLVNHVAPRAPRREEAAYAAPQAAYTGGYTGPIGVGTFPVIQRGNGQLHTDR